MLSELKAIFPEGKYIGNRYRITKPDASLFWERTFGPQMIVPWHRFGVWIIICFLESRLYSTCIETLKASKESWIGLILWVTPLKMKPHWKIRSIWLKTNTFRNSNLTFLPGNNSIINIRHYTRHFRLFQPWDQLLVNWKLLAVTHPGYASFMTYDEVKQTLAPFRAKVGSYLFRLSCTRLGQIWVLQYLFNLKFYSIFLYSYSELNCSGLLVMLLKAARFFKPFHRISP